jgi:hypothetical protein
MCTLTMGEHVFVLLDDPTAPNRADFLAAQAQAQAQARQAQSLSRQASPTQTSSQAPTTQGPSSAPNTSQTTTLGSSNMPPVTLVPPPHYRMSLFTLRPPGAIEHLLQQLRARWAPARQQTQNVRGQTGTSAANNTAAAARGPGHQLVVDGNVYRIGADWLVRVGNVILAGGAMKGVLLEVCFPILNMRRK